MEIIWQFSDRWHQKCFYYTFRTTETTPDRTNPHERGPNFCNTADTEGRADVRIKGKSCRPSVTQNPRQLTNAKSVTTDSGTPHRMCSTDCPANMIYANNTYSH